MILFLKFAFLPNLKIGCTKEGIISPIKYLFNIRFVWQLLLYHIKNENTIVLKKKRRHDHRRAMMHRLRRNDVFRFAQNDVARFTRNDVMFAIKCGEATHH